MFYFPNLRCRMDLELIPLKIELWGRLVFEASVFGVTILEELINKLLWDYTAKAIHMNIFKVGDIQPDKSPPDFSMYGTAVSVPHNHSV